jgi:hypothetical protein
VRPSVQTPALQKQTTTKKKPGTPKVWNFSFLKTVVMQTAWGTGSSMIEAAALEIVGQW